LNEFGVTTVGSLPPGLPQFTWPSLRLRDVDGVLPLAGACFLLAYVESVAAARTLGARHGYSVSPRQELLALAAANCAAAFGQGFPVAGGLSQSAVNDKAGARTPLALVFASATIAVCLLFFTDLLRNLPNVVLAAVVLAAVRGLIDVSSLRRLLRVSRPEFFIACAALAGVLIFGILKGVLLAVVISLLTLLTAAAAPHVAVLGRIPGTHRYSDADRHADNQAVPGTLIFRIESALLYFNAEHVRSVMWTRIVSALDLKLVVIDLSNVPHVDVAGAEMLAGLHDALEARGVRLRIVEAHSQVRDLLRAVELEHKVGYFGRHVSLDQTIAEFEQSNDSSVDFRR
jgi:MFS superfamily sulfate permease-like transporter